LRAATLLVAFFVLAASLGGCSPAPAPTAQPSAATSADPGTYLVAGCNRSVPAGWSVARVWDEAVLSLIRQVIPAPTVHARNLFHTAAAMWDAWAAYDPLADGYYSNEKHGAGDVAAAREAAMSYAAYRLLLWRYAVVSDFDKAPEQLDAVMASLCYRTDVTTTAGDSPAAVGNRIGEAIIAFGETDGALEDERYLDPAFRPLNEPLELGKPGTAMTDPNKWQPLSLAEQVAQNGLPIPGSVQTFLGSQWGHVTSFALPPAPDNGMPIDPGPPPQLGDPDTDAAYKAAALQVLRYSSQLDPADGVTMDISPASGGGNTLGSNDGRGYTLNAATGRPYEPEVVPRADFMRALAEFWADGPHSETPPGHWNVIANNVSDTPGMEHRIAGRGPLVDRLEWDVKLYFALNGATHDAGIAAWGIKGAYQSVRPISMIRFMADKGQSSDPSLAHYDPRGLPLETGLVEIVTRESSRPGERHAHLADHVGDIAVRTWRGFPEDPTTQTSGVGWILGADWVPYQRSTFVTPAFPGLVSGHSTFSRAAAEVMTAFTGSPWFPGGLSEWTTPAGTLRHELGPTTDVSLQWASYADAADHAGLSRLFMGIHVGTDDLEGRRIGAQCGTEAWALAQRYFAGNASS
jgi:hypothetical protein